VIWAWDGRVKAQSKNNTTEKYNIVEHRDPFRTPGPSRPGNLYRLLTPVPFSTTMVLEYIPFLSLLLECHTSWFCSTVVMGITLIKCIYQYALRWTNSIFQCHYCRYFCKLWLVSTILYRIVLTMTICNAAAIRDVWHTDVYASRHWLVSALTVSPTC
jgi:hypothetical protein